MKKLKVKRATIRNLNTEEMLFVQGGDIKTSSNIGSCNSFTDVCYTYRFPFTCTSASSNC